MHEQTHDITKAADAHFSYRTLLSEEVESEFVWVPVPGGSSGLAQVNLYRREVEYADREVELWVVERVAGGTITSVFGGQCEERAREVFAKQVERVGLLALKSTVDGFGKLIQAGSEQVADGGSDE